MVKLGMIERHFFFKGEDITRQLVGHRTIHLNPGTEDLQQVG